jgi:hypothetical protein
VLSEMRAIEASGKRTSLRRSIGTHRVLWDTEAEHLPQTEHSRSGRATISALQSSRPRLSWTLSESPGTPVSVVAGPFNLQATKVKTPFDERCNIPDGRVNSPQSWGVQCVFTTLRR